MLARGQDEAQPTAGATPGAPSGSASGRGAAASASSADATASRRRKVVLDVDTGVDDALAIAVVAGWEDAELIGCVATYGNVTAHQAAHNTAMVLQRCGFSGVPVLLGTTHPSWAQSFIPDAGCAQFHGPDGLGGQGEVLPLDALPLEGPPLGVQAGAQPGAALISVGGYPAGDVHAKPAASVPAGFLDAVGAAGAGNAGGTDAESRHPGKLLNKEAQPGEADVTGAPTIPPSVGATWLAEQVRRYGQELIVVSTGPLTTLDEMLRIAPELAASLHLVAMGGAVFSRGNCYDGVCETNIWQDPPAAHRVCTSQANLRLVGLDVTHRVLLGEQELACIRELAAGGNECARLMEALAAFSISANRASDAMFALGMPLHDPLAVAAALDPSLIDWLRLPIVVEQITGDGQGVRGRTVADFAAWASRTQSEQGAAGPSDEAEAPGSVGASEASDVAVACNVDAPRALRRIVRAIERACQRAAAE